MILRKICLGAEVPLQLLKLESRCLSTAELAQLQPEVLLNKSVKEACIQRLKLCKPVDNLGKNQSKAAVLVPLCLHDGKIGILYTLRSTKVSLNRGQVSFPGGMSDSTDKSLEDTALRETWEELGISQKSVEVWGTGNLIGRNNISVMPVLGYVGSVDPQKLNINTDEVEEAFVEPLDRLCEPQFCRFTQFKDSYTLPTYVGGKHRIWGLTAVITHLVMCSLIPDIYKHKVTFLKSIEDTNYKATNVQS